MAKSERTLTIRLTLDNEDRDHPGTPFREVLLTRIAQKLSQENFRVSGGEYEITIHRKGTIK